MRDKSTPINPTPSDIERFWSKVDRSGGPDACWPWKGALFANGYGLFHLHGKKVKAHRVAFVVCYGSIEVEQLACHDCPDGDNPACCNPRHLFTGSHDDNMADMARKGRAASGDRHPFRLHPELAPRGERNGAYTKPESRPRGDMNGSRLHPERRPYGERSGAYTHPESRRKGELNGRAKLTAGDVDAIRVAAASGESRASIARRYGVTRSTTARIVSGQRWADTEATRRIVLAMSEAAG